MKLVYPLTFTVSLLAAVMLPHIAEAQCPCSGGGGGQVTQYITIDTSTASRTLLTFNQFYDPTGTKSLTCIVIQDTVSLVSSTLARNTAASPVSNASFTVTVGSQITGPDGLNQPQQKSLNYGPYNFGPAGTLGIPKDSVVMGPDTIFNKSTQSFSPPSVVPYIGSGTISDTLGIGGGVFTFAGINFNYSIRSKYWGSARITYYWCPATALATSITNLTAIPNGNAILLQWLSNNAQNNVNYEIQISSDGKNFSSIGQAQHEPFTAGATAKYNYRFNLDPSVVGKIYFRIKQTDGSGQVSYSIIVVVNLNSPRGYDDEPITCQPYPNPATNSLTLQFNKNLTGRYLVELVNTAGQVVQREAATLTGISQIRLDLNPQPPKGLYFLRTTDQTRNHQYISKVFINN